MLTVNYFKYSSDILIFLYGVTNVSNPVEKKWEDIVYIVDYQLRDVITL